MNTKLLDEIIHDIIDELTDEPEFSAWFNLSENRQNQIRSQLRGVLSDNFCRAASLANTKPFDLTAEESIPEVLSKLALDPDEELITPIFRSKAN